MELTRAASACPCARPWQLPAVQILRPPAAGSGRRAARPPAPPCADASWRVGCTSQLVVTPFEICQGHVGTAFAVCTASCPARPNGKAVLCYVQLPTHETSPGPVVRGSGERHSIRVLPTACLPAAAMPLGPLPRRTISRKETHGALCLGAWPRTRDSSGTGAESFPEAACSHTFFFPSLASAPIFELAHLCTTLRPS